jgi:uncharacterized protein YjbI with pentapeptide repeats
MKALQLFGLTCLGVLTGISALAQQQPACPYPKGCKPTQGGLQRILSDHGQWADKAKKAQPGWPNAFEGRANLCNADLREVELSKADLFDALLNEADLRGAKLNEADLRGAQLNGADLRGADLNKAKLRGGALNEADLRGAKLNGADLLEATLNGANLSEAELNGARLSGAKLNGARLFNAELTEANLAFAELSAADLNFAKLNEATLSAAKLNKAKLKGAKMNKAFLREAELNEADLTAATLVEADLTLASVAGAHLYDADLTAARYAPKSPAPDAFVAQIKGLTSVVFPDGEEAGLLQLRDLLQKGGHRDLERQATFAIERGRTDHSIERKNPGDIAEGVFRKVAFDFTTRYGLEPSRALFSIALVWALLVPVYSWPIWRKSRQSKRMSGIYRVSPKDRIEMHDGKPSLDNPPRVERLHARGLATVGWAAYFSLLSAFQIGFREFSVGTWIARTQPRNFALEPTGWVRTLSGLQSLLSVYLLAIWLLTYFGRPFQ